MSVDFDVAICGGGMVGAAVAALLLHEPRLSELSIALIEPRFPTQPPSATDIDLRVSAISRASERMLKACGAWSHLDANSLSPYSEMIVWDAGAKAEGLGSLHFSASALGEPNLGYVVDNKCLQWALLEAATHSRVVKLGAQLSELTLEPDLGRLKLSDGRQITARLIVAADGAHSLSREQIGVASETRSYRQSAVVTHVQTERSHRGAAWQRFLPTGPIAFLPLFDGRSSIVWTTTPEHADELLKMSADEFAVAIENAGDHVLGAIRIAGPRAAFALQIAQAKEYCRPHFVLVGDAAHSIHPLAGQGVNLGFMDAAALVQTLAETRVVGASLESLGELRALRRYERWRKSENTMALGLVDGLNRLFSNANAAAGMVRRAGFGLLDRAPIAKRWLMLRALGLSGETPKGIRQVHS